MRIVDKGKYLWVLPQRGDTFQSDRLMGCRQRKNDPWFVVENNVVNRIVLNIKPYVLHRPAYDQSVNDSRLEDYQVADVKAMLNCPHVLNANPMGLGKTVEAIKYLEAIKAHSVLIVTPKIIRWQWVTQLDRWAGMTSEVYENQQKVDAGKIWIINYDKLLNNSTLTKMKQFQWDAVVLDEAHKIKNRKSQRTLACKSIPARHRVALTGTPILRYVDDLWSILNFLDESYSGISYWNFVNYFCIQQESPWGDKIVGLTKDTFKVDVLNKLMQEVSIRNDSIEVAHGKHIATVLLPMDKQQRVLYRQEKSLLLEELPENCTIANGAVLTTRLRQTTSWPGLYIEGINGPKFEWILEMCLNNPNKKIVVFSVFEKTISGLVKYLADNKVCAVSITGQNDAKLNEQHKQAFLSKDNVQVLAGTIGAMGQGYDGLQEVSYTLVFVDREWSPEIMAQAEDRLHRMGQNNLVNVYYLECQGSFDQHVGRINQNKSDDIRRALSSE